LLILCYHGFAQADEHLWNPSLYVTRSHLESRLELLAAGGYEILPLAEALGRLVDGTLPARAVAITIDDGTYDFFAVAYPVLKRFGVPVTLYVSTYYVVHRQPVFDSACQYLFWKARASGTLRPQHSLSEDWTPINSDSDCARAATRLCERASQQHWAAEQKHQWLERFASRAGLDWQGFVERRLFTLMGPQELAALDPGIVDVQLHTHRHRAQREREPFLREIADNRRALAQCGLDPQRLVHFCYPGGVYEERCLSWLAEAGITSAVTCVPGLASKRDHLFLLPRFIDTGTTSEVEFEAWTSGLRQVFRRPRLRFTG
jgi:peptidoglycan/xylan/chitin deacetylase (PgdA/CDA1 family)